MELIMQITYKKSGSQWKETKRDFSGLGEKGRDETGRDVNREGRGEKKTGWVETGRKR